MEKYKQEVTIKIENGMVRLTVEEMSFGDLVACTHAMLETLKEKANEITPYFDTEQMIKDMVSNVCEDRGLS